MRRAGAQGEILLRADSGFWNKEITKRLRQKGCRYSIGVRITKPVAQAIEQIDDSAWQTLEDYPDTGEAQIAQSTLGDDRLVVRRVRTLDDHQQLFATWQHFAFITNRTEPLEIVEAEHRAHATVELVIRDLIDQVLAHFPSGKFKRQRRVDGDRLPGPQPAPLVRRHRPARPPAAPRTHAAPLLELPGRLTRTARRWTLHLPARWPGQDDWVAALARIRALPALG